MHCFARILGWVGRLRTLRAPGAFAALSHTRATTAAASVVCAEPAAGYR